MQEIINHSRGQSLDLKSKSDNRTYDLSSVTFGLGGERRQKRNLFGKIFNTREEKINFDAFAFLLDREHKVANLGRTIQTGSGRKIEHYNGDIVFFNSVKHASGHVWLTGDPLSAMVKGDEEQIVVKFDSLEEKYHRIVFGVSLLQRNQHAPDFSMLESCYIRAVDAHGEEIVCLNLSQNIDLKGMRTLVLCEAYREGDTWKLQLVEEPYPTNSYLDILKLYS